MRAMLLGVLVLGLLCASEQGRCQGSASGPKAQVKAGIIENKTTPESLNLLANNTKLNLDVRRRAVLELFKRYVHAGMSVSDMGNVLRGATWLGASDVGVAEVLGGWVPLDLAGGKASGNTMAYITLYSLARPSGPLTLQREDYTRVPDVWMLIEGKVDVNSLRRSIFGKGERSNGSPRIMQINTCVFAIPDP